MPENEQNNNRDRLFDRIRKCLALSKSSNEYEAAAALRQARALLREAKLSQADFEAQSVREASAKGTVKPTYWHLCLIDLIEKAFGVTVVCMNIQHVHRKSAQYKFFGEEASADVAQYAFDVLRRQALRAKREYMATQPRHVLRKASLKRKYAESFLQGWVLAVQSLLTEFAGKPDEEKQKRINHYVTLHYGGYVTTDQVPNKRHDKALLDGFIQGKNARLHHGVSEKQASPALLRNQ